MGCRARAYAATGDYLAEEPFCVYEPKSAHLKAKVIERAH
jgi:MoaA/NifB/PqqE/SkfB family radical SAM enzyme